MHEKINYIKKLKKKKKNLTMFDKNCPTINKNLFMDVIDLFRWIFCNYKRT